MRAQGKCKQIASLARQLGLKGHLDVDAPAKTAVCMNHLEEKRDKPVGEQLH